MVFYELEYQQQSDRLITEPIGLFIGLSWLLSRALGVHEHATTLLPELEEDESPEALPALISVPAAASGPAARGRLSAPTAPAPLA